MPPDATMTTIITSTSTYDQSSQTTTSTVDSTMTVTKTVTQAGPTFYAACDSNNLATNANGGSTISGVGVSGSNYGVSAHTTYDCCAACQASNCKAAFFFADAYPTPVCYNSFQDTCTPGSVTDYFYTYSDQSSDYASGNGPCGQIHHGGDYPSYY